MTNKTELNARQQSFVNAYLRNGGNGAAAARAAGYGEKSQDSARRRATALLNVPAVAEAIKAGRAEIAEVSKLDAIGLLKKLQDAEQYARETKNATALVRAIELQGKACGLLDQRVEVSVNSTVDIVAAWKEAKERALGVTTVQYEELPKGESE